MDKSVAVAVDKGPASSSPTGEKGTATLQTASETMTSPTNPSLKWVSLVTLTLQNVALILVVMAEMCKFLTCLAVIFYLEGYDVVRWFRHLKTNTWDNPWDCLKISVPSIVYTLQNNLLFVAVSNLEAATFQVTYQLKILTTAFFSVLILRKQLAKLQWLALLLLFIGVSAVQMQPHDPNASSKVNTVQRPLVGLVAVIVSSLMSGFAGVYFEKILKGTQQTLWLRNVQLGFIGMITGYITMQLNDGGKVAEQGFFFGYDYFVWIVIGLNSFGGLLVAVVVKYADNILKGFATSAAIILSCVVSMYLFDFKLSLQFCFGAGLVIASVYMYGRFVIPTDKPKTVARV